MKKSAIFLSIALAISTVIPSFGNKPERVKAAGTVKIMPIGDSITFGMGDDGGYRKFMDMELKSKGISFDMVGPEGSNSASFTYNGQQVTYDNNHAGYSGYTIASIPGWNNGGGVYDKLKSNGAVSQMKPDIITLMIGTNDMNGSRAVSDCEKDLKTLLDFLHDNMASGGTIYLSTIPDIGGGFFGGGGKDVSGYNNLIKQVASEYSSKNVKYADAHGVLNGTNDLGDGLHPNRNGYEKIGKYFAGLIAEGLGSSGGSTTDANQQQGGQQGGNDWNQGGQQGGFDWNQWGQGGQQGGFDWNQWGQGGNDWNQWGQGGQQGGNDWNQGGQTGNDNSNQSSGSFVRDTYKIMPIGDSITFGMGDDGGYRKFLDMNLKDKGIKFDMVGPEGSNSASFTYNGQQVTYDNNHAGYSGYTIASIPGWNNGGGVYDKLKSNGAVTQNKPDIIILMIGTNDMNGSRAVSDCEKDLKTLLDYLHDNMASGGMIFLSTIPDIGGGFFGGGGKDVSGYNNLIKQVASEYSSKNVKYADAHGVLNGTNDLGDGLHPNRNGYEKIGKYFAGLIADEISKAAPVETTTTTVTEPVITTTTTTTTEQTTVPSAEIIYGDLNGDGVADLTDLTLLSVYLMRKQPGDSVVCLEAGDVDGDGYIDLSDLPRFKQYISKDSAVSKLGPNR